MKDFIYTRDLSILVGEWKWWCLLMESLIKCLEDHVKKENNYANNLYISYVKDKYWRLRCEYSWWDNYTDNLIENVEDLSQYLPYSI
jgi:hypothetical protein